MPIYLILWWVRLSGRLRLSLGISTDQVRGVRIKTIYIKSKLISELMKGKHIVLLCLLCSVIGAFLYRTAFPCKENTIITTDTIYVNNVSYDTIIQEKPVPVTITEVQIINDTAYLYYPVDTAHILADYHSTRKNDDVLKDDSTGYVHLTESVSQNAIFDRTLYFESRGKDKIVTNTLQNDGFYLMGGLGSSGKNIALSGGLIYISPSGRLGGLSVGHTGKPYLQLHYGFKF